MARQLELLEAVAASPGRRVVLWAMLAGVVWRDGHPIYVHESTPLALSDAVAAANDGAQSLP